VVHAVEAVTSKRTVSTTVEEKPLQDAAECARNQTVKMMNRKRNACWSPRAMVKLV